MIAESVIAELRAEPRRFRSVCGALRWWTVEMARRRCMGAGHLDSMAVSSRPAFDIRDVTFARVTACLAPRAPEDTDSDRKLTPRRIANLLVWYDSTEQQSAGSNEGARKTRNQIRRRMANRGLLEGE